MNWLTTLVGGVLKPIAEGWGSTLRYKRDKAAKQAALDNLRLYVTDELEERLKEHNINKDVIRKVLRDFKKDWDRFDDDSIIKG